METEVDVELGGVADVGARSVNRGKLDHRQRQVVVNARGRDLAGNNLERTDHGLHEVAGHHRREPVHACERVTDAKLEAVCARDHATKRRWRADVAVAEV